MTDHPLPLVIYVDVDDTFVRSYGTQRIPIPAVIKHVRALWQQGAELYCWSSGGAEYAKESAAEFGIGECFTAFLPKPNILLDDQRVSGGACWKFIRRAMLPKALKSTGKSSRARRAAGKKLGNTERGIEILRCAAQTPNVHLHGQGNGLSPRLLYPRRRLLGVCAPQSRTLFPRRFGARHVSESRDRERR